MKKYLDGLFTDRTRIKEQVQGTVLSYEIGFILRYFYFFHPCARYDRFYSVTARSKMLRHESG